MLRIEEHENDGTLDSEETDEGRFEAISLGASITESAAIKRGFLLEYFKLEEK